MADEAGLFEEPGAAPVQADRGVKRSGDGDPKERRQKLKAYDSVAHQQLNPFGFGLGKVMSVEDCWKAAAEGNHRCMFHTNLAAGINTGGPFRVGIGLSQISESLLAAIEHLKNDNAIKQVIVEKHLKAALDEAKDLEQDLQIWNAGKGSQKTDATALGFNRFRAAAAAQSGSGRNFSDDDVRKAARKFHEWLSKEKTPLRALLAIMGAHGVFYAAQVNEKVARGWVHHKPASVEAAQEAAIARRTESRSSGSTAANPDNSADGLID